jgi:hypothetical protein
VIESPARIVTPLAVYMNTLSLGLLCAALVGCTAQTAPTTTSESPPTGSTLPRASLCEPAPCATDQLGPAPPGSVQQALARNVLMKFVPLSLPQLAEVSVSANAAARTALSRPGPGYGPDGAKVAWNAVGCIFLGWYTGERMPRVGYVPPTYAAYLVQVLGDPVPEFPLINIGVAVVDAHTGEFQSEYGGGPPPFGIMGTTCGVTP